MAMDGIYKALEIAYDAHKDQMDKGGKPYILHPITVALMQDESDAKIVALLHDVVEDTDYTLKDLFRAGFSQKIVEAVDAISKRIEETVDEYYERVKANSIAIEVKKADLCHNMQLNRLPVVTLKDLDRAKFYAKRFLELCEYTDRQKVSGE